MGSGPPPLSPPPVMIESTEVRRWVTHMLCWSCGMYFSAAASSEKDHGSMNLDSNTASMPSTIPSRVATIHAIAECLTRRCTSRTRRPVLRSYQERLSSSVAEPSCTMRLPDRSSGSASPLFSCHRRTRAASSAPIMIRASEPPMNELRATGLRNFNSISAMARGPEEAEAAFATISQEGADAVVVQGIFFSKTITELALKYRLPTASVVRQFAEAGGLISYGADIRDIYRRSATLVH